MMINEYLFLTDEQRQEIEQYKPKDVTVEISNIENTTHWIAAYSLSSENEGSAKKLSEIHSYILKFSPFVLSCASSEYYNKMLFPFVNEFERKLRKLLYLATSISSDTKAKECTKSLESKDFGQIFSDWFIDLGFINKIRSRVNANGEFNGKDRFSKAEIQAYIGALTEETLWNMTLGNDAAPTLRNRFRDIHNYRNDVMHAHNTFDNEEFGKAYTLFSKVNKELDDVTNKFIAKAKKMTIKEKQDVSDKISSTIAEMDVYSIWPEFIKNTVLFTSSYSNAFNGLAGIDRSIQDLIKGTSFFPSIDALKSISGVSSPMAEGLKGIASPLSFPMNNSINGISGISSDALRAFQSITASPIQSELSRPSKAVNAFPPMPGMTKFTEQMNRVEKAVRPHSDLQKSICSITDRQPKDADSLGKPDDDEMPKDEDKRH